MRDICKEPYAEWLEGALRGLVELRPVSIGIVSINEDGTTGTTYFNIRSRERWAMVRALIQDDIIDFMKINADVIREILDDEGSGEE